MISCWLVICYWCVSRTFCLHLQDQAACPERHPSTTVWDLKSHKPKAATRREYACARVLANKLACWSVYGSPNFFVLFVTNNELQPRDIGLLSGTKMAQFMFVALFGRLAYTGNAIRMDFDDKLGLILIKINRKTTGNCCGFPKTLRTLQQIKKNIQSANFCDVCSV